jgi:tripartite-type tricarboxylate transporter receptor subunit TctC
MRRYVVRLLAPLAVVLSLSAGSALAQSYPARPIRLVIPFPAGGATDIVTRAIAVKLADALAQPVVVDNKPGAGGAIGSDLVAKAAPDGYTILLTTTSTHSVGPALNPRLPYNVERDFIPVTHVADATNVLIVSQAVPAKSVRELVALAKAKPGGLAFGSSGTGTIVHLSGELFKSLAGVDLLHVPYKGTQLAIPDVISGQVALIFDNIASALPHVRAGKVRALAVTSAKRSSLLPELPTMIEAGVPGYVSDTYFGVFTPAGTPREIVTRLNQELNRVIQQPDLRERFANQGIEPVGGTPEQFAQVIRSETAKWGKVIRDAGVKVE